VGSISVTDQKFPVTHTWAWDRQWNHKLPLERSQMLQTPQVAEAGLVHKLLLSLTCRGDAAASEAAPAAVGLSVSMVSWYVIQACAVPHQALQERDLAAYDVVTLVLNGKTFAQGSMVIALDVTLTGEQVVLGFVQTATENERVYAAFLRQRAVRGLRLKRGPLVILDGAEDLRAAVTSVIGAQILGQRFQWHQRETIVASRLKALQGRWRRTLQAASARPTFVEAKVTFSRLRPELRLLNESAATSLDEELEETLAAPPWPLPRGRDQPQDDDLARVPQQPGGATRRLRGSLAQFRPAPTLSRRRPAGPRTTPPTH